MADHLGTWDDPIILLDRQTGYIVWLWIHNGVWYYKTGVNNPRPTGGTDGVVLPDAAAVAALIAIHAALPDVHHAKQHAIDAIADHTIGGLTNTYLVKSDGSKVVPGTNTDAQVADAVSRAHDAAHALSAHSAAVADLDIGGYLMKNPAGLFGAAGNCVLDASKYATLNAAAVALPAEGGTILVPAGTTATIDVDSQVAIGARTVHVIGQGSPYSSVNRSVINLAGAPGAISAFLGAATYGWLHLENLCFTATTASSQWYLIKTDSDNRLGISMKRCYLQGNKIRALLSVSYYCPGVIMEDVRAEVWNIGVTIPGGLAALYYVPFLFDNVQIIFPTSPIANAYGFLLSGGLSVLYPPIVCRNCGVQYGGTDWGGWLLYNWAVPLILHDCFSISCKGNGLTMYPGADFVYPEPCLIRGFRAINNDRHGISIAGATTDRKVKVVIDGAVLINNGYLAPYNYDGISVDSYVAELDILNSRAYSDGTRQRNALNFTSATEVEVKRLTNNNFESGFKGGGAAIKFYSAAQRQAIKAYSGNIADTISYSV